MTTRTLNGVPFRQVWLPKEKYSIKAPYAMQPRKVTLHETDNQMPASKEIQYMNSNNNLVSYHGAVDDKEYIQAIPYNRNAWHAGDGLNGYGNRNTIAIEICQNYDRTRQTTALLEPLSEKYQKGVENAIKVVAQILVDEKIVANYDNIKTHNDWNGKHCPRKMRNDNRVLIVKAGIINEYGRIKNGEPEVIPTSTPKPSGKKDAHLSLSQVVDKTIAGGYGIIPAREKNINEQTNYSFKQVQDLVNVKLKTPVKTAPAPKPKPKPQPKPVAKIAVDGYLGKQTVRALQRALGTFVDGEIWGQPRNQNTQAMANGVVKYGTAGSPMVRALQRKVGAAVDGKWGAQTTTRLQRYLGTFQDGIISRPSNMVRELQRRLNNGTF